MAARETALRIIGDYLAYVMWTRQYNAANDTRDTEAMLKREWWLENGDVVRIEAATPRNGDLLVEALRRDLVDIRNGKLPFEPRAETFKLAAVNARESWKTWDSFSWRKLSYERALRLITGPESNAEELYSFSVSVPYATTLRHWRDASFLSILHPVPWFRATPMLSVLAQIARLRSAESKRPLTESPVFSVLYLEEIEGGGEQRYELRIVDDGNVESSDAFHVAFTVTNCLIETKKLPRDVRACGYVIFEACEDGYGSDDECVTGDSDSRYVLIFILNPVYRDATILYDYRAAENDDFGEYARLTIGLAESNVVNNTAGLNELLSEAKRRPVARAVERFAKWLRNKIGEEEESGRRTVVFDSFASRPSRFGLSYALSDFAGNTETSLVTYRTKHRDRLLLRLLRRYDFLLERRLPRGRGVNFPLRLRATDETWRRYEDATQRDRYGGEAARVEHRGRDGDQATLLVRRTRDSRRLNERWATTADRSIVLLADPTVVFGEGLRVEKIVGGGKRAYRLAGATFFSEPPVKFVGASKPDRYGDEEEDYWLASALVPRFLREALRLNENRGNVRRNDDTLLVVTLFRDAATLYFPLKLDLAAQKFRREHSATARCYADVPVEIAVAVEKLDARWYGSAAS